LLSSLSYVLRLPPRPTLFPYTTLFRSTNTVGRLERDGLVRREPHPHDRRASVLVLTDEGRQRVEAATAVLNTEVFAQLGLDVERSEEHTSELQSRENLVCRLLLEKKKT